MRDLLALDARDPAAANAMESTHRTAAPERTYTGISELARRSGARAGETTTMIVVLVAWALIAGYLFAHVAEGAVMAGTQAPVAVAGSRAAAHA